MRRLHFLNRVTMLVFLTVAVVAFYSDPAWAGPTSWEAGLRAGASFNDDEETFNQYDVFVNYGLPWSWRWGQSIQVDTNLTTTLGIIDGGGDNGVAGSLGFEFVFGPAGGSCPFEMRAGSALTLISEDKYGDEDFGGPLQFTHHIGLQCWLLDNLNAFARVQHMSNADLYESNPGLNLVMLGLIYRF